MVGSIREHRRINVFVATLIAALGTIAAFASVALSGTKTGFVLAIIAILGPALLYGALRAPIVFPFGLYLLLIPFNNLLTLDAFGTVTKMAAIASGAAMLFYMLRVKRSNVPPDVLVIWVLYYLWMIATTFWALDTQAATDLLPTAVQLLLLYGIIAIFPMDLARLRTVVAATIAGGTAASLYGIALFKAGAAGAIAGGRLWLTTDNSSYDPNHFAAALILPVALALVGVLWTQRLIIRVFYGIAVSVMLLAMAYSASRGALLGVAAVIAFLLIRDRHRLQLAGVCAVVIGLVLSLQTSLIARFGAALSTGGAGRVEIWKVGFAALKKFWLIGAGYGNFPFAYDRAFLSVYQSTFNGEHRAPHNILLQNGVELGILGLLLLLLAWYGHFRLLQPIADDDSRHPVRLAVQGALIGLFIAGLFLDIMITKYLWLVFMFAVLVRNTRTEPLRDNA